MFNSDRIKSDVFALILLGGLVFWTLALLSYDASDPPSGIVFPPRLVPQGRVLHILRCSGWVPESGW